MQACLVRLQVILGRSIVPFPTNLILAFLFYESYSLQDIGDVVYSTLLDRELARGAVEVQDSIRRGLEQGDELLGEKTE